MCAELEKPRLVALAPPPEGVATADVHEFLARPAHWLLTAGTWTIACFLALLLILSVVIKYPDTITSRVTIIGTQPVVEIVARQSGYLESLQVRER